MIHAKSGVRTLTIVSRCRKKQDKIISPSAANDNDLHDQQALHHARRKKPRAFEKQHAWPRGKTQEKKYRVVLQKCSAKLSRKSPKNDPFLQQNDLKSLEMTKDDLE